MSNYDNDDEDKDDDATASTSSTTTSAATTSAAGSSTTSTGGAKQKRKYTRSTDNSSWQHSLVNALNKSDEDKDKEENDDEDQLFFMSLVPSLKSLDDETKMRAKIRLQQVLFEMRFPAQSHNTAGQQQQQYMPCNSYAQQQFSGQQQYAHPQQQYNGPQQHFNDVQQQQYNDTNEQYNRNAQQHCSAEGAQSNVQQQKSNDDYVLQAL